MTIETWIASTSLAISLSTLYLVHFRKAKLSCRIGPEIKIYYADRELGGSFGIYIPTTFINSSARTGTVLNVAVSMFRTDSPEQQHFMLWRQFSKLDVEKNKWVYSEPAHALAVPGNSALNKIIWFFWYPATQPKITLSKGSYTLRLHFWDAKERSPYSQDHKFFLGDKEIEILEGYRQTGINLTIDVPLDKELEINRSMTQEESRKLLA